MEDILNFVAVWLEGKGWLPSWTLAAFVILLASKELAQAIVALTPTPADDKWVGKIYKWVERLAGVVGRVKEQPSNTK